MSDPNIRRASLEDISRMRKAGELYYDPDAPAGGEILPPGFWDDAVVVAPKQASARSVHLTLDPDVVAFFEGGGEGHLTRMQDVLSAYARSHRER